MVTQILIREFRMGGGDLNPNNFALECFDEGIYRSLLCWIDII